MKRKFSELKTRTRDKEGDRFLYVGRFYEKTGDCVARQDGDPDKIVGFPPAVMVEVDGDETEDADNGLGNWR